MEPEKNMNMTDELRVNGVRSKGFGQLAKAAMLDQDLSVTAKGIFAYFVSFTGAGNNTAFPSVSRILHDLGIAKNTYYKHFRMLTETGYITTEQKGSTAGNNVFQHNIYTLEDFPKKYKLLKKESISKSETALNKALEEICCVEDIHAAGYGNIPKLVMQDHTLSIKARALYAYFCVFAGESLIAVPEVRNITYHLGMSVDAYRDCMKELLKEGYIIKSQNKINGRFSGNSYRILNNPGQEEPQIHTPAGNSADLIQNKTKNTPFEPKGKKQPGRQNCDTGKTISSYGQNCDTQLCDTEKQDTDISETQIQYTEDCETKTNEYETKKIYNKKSVKNKQSIKNDNPSSAEISRRKIEKEPKVSFQDQYEKILEEIVLSEHFPYEYSADPDRLKVAVRVITDWPTRSDGRKYRGDRGRLKYRLYMLLLEALTEMLTEGNITMVSGVKHTSKDVIEALNEVLEVSFPDEPEMQATLGKIVDSIFDSYLERAQQTEIVNEKAYLKTIIWTQLATTEISDLIAVDRDFGA